MLGLNSDPNKTKDLQSYHYHRGGERVSELGALLKKARIERGITLEQLQDITKIRKRYLEAIEEGEFNVLPGSFYARAFIKSYAEAVGLNPDEIVRLYRGAIPETEPPALQLETVRAKSKSKAFARTDKIARWAATLLVLFFFVLIAAIIYHFVLSNQDGGQNHLADDPPLTDRTNTADTGSESGNTPDPDTAPPETTPEDEEEPAPPDPELLYVTTDGTTHIYNVTNAASVVLELSMTESDCWVWVKKGGSDGEEIAQKTYRKGETITWEVEDSAYIRLGFPRGVTLKVNGIAVEKERLNTENPINLQFNLLTQTP